VAAPSDPDHALSLLAERYAETQGKRIWVADENSSAPDAASLRFGDDTVIVTNRIDIHRVHARQHPFIELSDFRFEQAPAGEIDAVFYRVSKEKSVVHHVINRSSQLLKLGGSLFLAGYKGDGTRTYFDKAKQLFGGAAEWKKAKHGAYCGRLTKSSETVEEQLETQDYSDLRPIAELGDVRFLSKPGIFGWNKIDEGSALLIEGLPAFLGGLTRPPATLLDLGCGFGYLAVMAGKQLEIPITATDNNIAATAACERNIEINGIEGEVLLDDCGTGIDSRFDALLCNPPFHQGFSSEGELTQRFVEACRRLLAPGGAALFVVNQFIPLEAVARTAGFDGVDVLSDNGSFKLIRLESGGDKRKGR